MLFINAAFGALALATAVVAQSTSLYFTTLPGAVTAGQTYTVSYYAADKTDPVTILLRQGPSTNLQTVGTLTSTSTGGTYQWTVDSSLPAGSDYALEITQGDEVNYSGQFTLSSTVSSSSSVAASSSLVVVSSSSSVAASSSMLSVSASSSTLTAAASSSSIVSVANATITATFPILTPPSNLTMTPSSNMSTTPAYGTPSSTVTTTAGGAGSSGAVSSSYAGPMSGAGAAFLVSPVAMLVGVVAAFAYLN